MNRILISIAIMAVTTYLIRMLPMVLCLKINSFNPSCIMCPMLF